MCMGEVLDPSFASFPQTVNISCKSMSKDVKTASEFNSPEMFQGVTKIAEAFRSNQLQN